MKNIKELGLELIELDDQVLLVDKRIQPVNNWYFDTYIKKVKNTSGAEYAKDAQVIQIISSTKPLKGLPLLVIEDEIDELFFEELAKETPQAYDQALLQATKHGFKYGYNKAKETSISFDDEFDLANKIRVLFLKHGKDSWVSIAKELIMNETKKELWIEIENYCGSPYTTERCPKCVDSCDMAYQRPKILNGKIKAIWK